MRPHKQRAWNQELKMMIQSEEILTRDNIYMILNTSEDYIWMRTAAYEDKNKQEIFEDDVVRMRGDIHLVDLQWFFYEVCEFGIEGKDIEVLGNIYENPELKELLPWFQKDVDGEENVN